MIPQCDPLPGYLSHKSEIEHAITRVLNSGWYILGQEVEAFEQEFAAWLGVSHVVGVANGTDAIELALRAASVGAGDTVATVSHTAVATVAAIRRCGAEPAFVDIEPDYYTMDANSLMEVVASKPEIRAVVVVHLYGQMANMPEILEIADLHNLIVIEDCAQAHGASLNGTRAGSWGDIGCFSFYPTKNLGALGDAGAIVTKDATLGSQLRALRQYGWNKERTSEIEGVNSRLDELQAAILRVRLKSLNDSNAARKNIAIKYQSILHENAGISLPIEREGAGHVYHQYVIRCENRKVLTKALTKADIGYAIHYPQPVHLQPAYANAKFSPVPLGHTEGVTPSILSLPMYPELTADAVAKVAAVINQSGIN